MKKAIFITFITSILSFSAFATSYKIDNADYEVQGNFWGTTNVKTLQANYPIDTNKTYTEEEYQKLITNYKKNLESTRLFEEVVITEETVSEDEEAAHINLKVFVKDSNHFLAMPYPKYSTNDGITLKIKAKDTNFLGTMNTMNCDINLNYDNNVFKPSVGFNYDYPFNFEGINLTWINDYNFSYTIGNQVPDISLKTGVRYVKSYDHYSYVFTALQYANYANSYKTYKDELYFTENLNFSTPITVYTFKNFSTLNYSPYIDLSYYWDADGINPANTGLLSPVMTVGHSVSNGNVKWDGNFRRGYSLSLSNNYKYNFINADYSPSVSFDASLFTHFKWWDRDFLDEFGIYTNFHSFVYVDMWGNQSLYGESIGGRLRGKLDSSYLGDTGTSTTTTGAVINIDLPHHFFRTNFKNDLFNFDTQAVAFLDIGIFSENKSIKPSLKKPVICAGLEGLVFPKKFSSFIIRGSFGVDVLKALKDPAGVVKGVWHNKEIFIGLGTSY